MAFIGELFLAGSEHLGGKYKSGVAFSLSKMSPLSCVYEINAGSWQVELKKGADDIIARSASELGQEELQADGFAAIQTALDILCVKRQFSAYVVRPAERNIGIYWGNGRSLLYIQSLFDCPMGVNARVQQFGIDGREIAPPPVAEPTWNESFRYYRLSQSSDDLFEAYRNLFLAFESLLNSISPKGANEGEAVWLKRVLAIVDARMSLSPFAPTGSTDPVKYIMDSQYINVRCKLQHAKFPNAELPHSCVNPVDVKRAYSELIRIWNQIASAYFNVPIGGGVITHTGFEMIMANSFKDSIAVLYTGDDQPSHSEDTAPSPRSFPVYEFAQSSYEGQVYPGVVRVVANEDIVRNAVNYINPIYRVCSKAGASLVGVTYIEQGLVVSGVDCWMSIQDFRLINTAQPSIDFET